MTTVLVSHDLEEAIYLADDILLMSRRPAQVADLVNFDMVRARHADSLIDPHFVAIKARCLEVFQREVRKA